MKDNQTLTILNKKGKEIPVIDSREVATMLESKHYKILEKLEGTKDGKTKGIIPILTAHDFVVSNYFIESSYKDKSGRENKCYLCTKLGCDFLANKFTGEKGILFTAKYVERFNQMEEKLKKLYTPSYMIEDPIKRAEKWINEEKERQQLREENNLLKPKGDFYDEVIDSTTVIGMKEAADILNVKGYGRNNLLKFLRENGILNRKNEPYRKYIDQGLFEVKESKYIVNNEVKIKTTTYVTQKGLDYIRKMLKNKQ